MMPPRTYKRPVPACDRHSCLTFTRLEEQFSRSIDRSLIDQNLFHRAAGQEPRSRMKRKQSRPAWRREAQTVPLAASWAALGCRPTNRTFGLTARLFVCESKIGASVRLVRRPDAAPRRTEEPKQGRGQSWVLLSVSSGIHRWVLHAGSETLMPALTNRWMMDDSLVWWSGIFGIGSTEDRHSDLVAESKDDHAKRDCAPGRSAAT